tara:strand:+ start:8865 stop:9239 length:375 start_codon:yes stop_codon:yes gene_type:complete
LPIVIDGKRETRLFESKKDVWDVIDLLIEEAKEFNEKQGKDFDLCQSILSQLPFFACPNVLMDKNIHKDIERYIYCEKFGLPPYKGSYGDQPYRWVNRSFAIKVALAKREKREIDGARSKKNNS